MHEETVVLENRLSELLKLQDAVGDLGDKYGLSGKAVHDLSLVLEEAVVNIIYYAYENKDEKHEIFVRFSVENRELVVSVEDDGKPFDPLAAPGPEFTVSLEKRKPGGLGIHFMRSLAKALSYRRAEERNILTVRMGI